MRAFFLRGTRGDNVAEVPFFVKRKKTRRYKKCSSYLKVRPFISFCLIPFDEKYLTPVAIKSLLPVALHLF